MFSATFTSYFFLSPRLRVFTFIDIRETTEAVQCNQAASVGIF